MGWVGSKHFLPGLGGEVEIEIDDTSSMSGLINGYREEGTLAEWISKIGKPARRNPLSRFLLAASFAAPLLRLLNERPFIVHLYGPSKGGKTAALKAALSAWGDPSEIMANFNSTKVGFERMAGFFCDLPMGIDERQVIGDSQKLVDNIVYALVQGQGKIRGAKGGGLQATHKWQTIFLTTGEEPLTVESSREGTKTRALELYGRIIEDESMSRRLHHESAKHYGFAGPLFVKKLIEKQAEDKNSVLSEFQETVEALSGAYTDYVSAHITYISIVTLADYYISQWIFGETEGAAGSGSIENAENIIESLDTQTETSETNRAYEFIHSWFRINEPYFKGEERQHYGEYDGIEKILYIYPPIFEDAMKSQGYSPGRVLKDWRNEDRLVITDDGRKRLKVRKWDYSNNEKSWFIGVKLENGE